MLSSFLYDTHRNFRCCYNGNNTLTALEEKNKESVATRKSQLQLKHIKLASIISKNSNNVLQVAAF